MGPAKGHMLLKEAPNRLRFVCRISHWFKKTCHTVYGIKSVTKGTKWTCLFVYISFSITSRSQSCVSQLLRGSRMPALSLDTRDPFPLMETFHVLNSFSLFSLKIETSHRASLWPWKTSPCGREKIKNIKSSNRHILWAYKEVLRLGASRWGNPSGRRISYVCF